MRRPNVVALSLVVALWTVPGVLGLPTLASAEGGEGDGFDEVVAFHLERYPELEVQDLYKLAYQAACGPQHAVPSRDAARQWLDRELAGLSETHQEPLIEPLSPDGALVRINLRPYVERGGEATILLDALIQTAVDFDGCETRFEQYWATIEAMAGSGALPFPSDRLASYWLEMKDKGLPVVHHSAIYRELYQPAYRVVFRRLVGIDGDVGSVGSDQPE